jgi:NAD(P)-dependent dehydrogenase (short-subunit alcohol dehydrogenase family)
MFVDTLLEGRVALVTGASRGLGRHFAALLARHGAHVVGVARDAGGLAAIEAELAAQGRVLTPLAADVRDGASVERAFGEALARAGRLDIVVNNAGIALTKPASATSDDEWNAVIDTNLSGAFRVARAAAAAMESGGHGGSIVNIASVLARRVARQLPAYIAAKAALVKLTEALALEWAPIGVRVNALAPGYVGTEMTLKMRERPELFNTWIDMTPMGRLGTPQEIASAILFLASSASSYVTGAILSIDGGYTAW